MLQVTVHQAKTNLSRLIKKVLSGEEVVIARGNQPVVKLISIEQAVPQRRLGSAKGRIRISEDFDSQLDDFKEYMS